MRLTLSWAALVPGGSGSMADPLFMVQPGLLGASDTWNSTITQGFEGDAPARAGGLEVNPPRRPANRRCAHDSIDRYGNMKVQMPREFGGRPCVYVPLKYRQCLGFRRVEITVFTFLHLPYCFSFAVTIYIKCFLRISWFINLDSIWPFWDYWYW